MPFSSQNINTKRKRALVVPLDWGLGHATRCIPIINELKKQHFEVLLAAENAVSKLLQLEFPEIEILPLKGYGIKYSKQKRLFLLKIFQQLPKIATAISRENKWLKKIIEEKQIDILISDNRFGLHHHTVPCIFITHQLFIKTGNVFFDWAARKVNHFYINKFTACWVPDEAGADNLSGNLSHQKTNTLKIPTQFIGALSRCSFKEVEKSIDLLVMLSGPEPQRTMFENIVMRELEYTQQNIVILRGLPSENTSIEKPNTTIKILNHAKAEELNKLMLSAKYIVARSGYSTIMDIAALQQKAALVPTPGQTEQMYLAKHLAEKKYCIAVEQHQFVLKNVLDQMNSTTFQPFPTANKLLLQKAIDLLK